MLRRAVFAVLLGTMVLSAQTVFSHDTDTSEILRELRELRDDLNAFLVPVDVSGRWQKSGERCTGNVPAWIQDIFEGMGFSNTVRIRQYGNHLTTEVRYGGGTGYGTGIIRGDYMRFDTQIAAANDEIGLVAMQATLNATVLSSGRMSYSVQVQIAVGDEAYAQSCTGEFRHIGN